MDEALMLDFEVPTASGEGFVPPLVTLLRSGASVAEIDEARKQFMAGVNESEASLERLFVLLTAEPARACMAARSRFKAAYQALRRAVGGEADEILQARVDADEAASTLRETVLRALGPTSIGGLNLLARLLEEEAGGRPAFTSLDRVLRSEMDATRNALAVVPRGRVEEALRDLRAVLSTIMQREDEDDLAAMRESLVAASQRLETASTRDDFTVLEAVIEALRGGRDIDGLREEIPLLRADLAELRASLESGLRQGRADPATAGQAQTMVGLLERCDRLLGAFLDGGEVGAELGEALEQLQSMRARIEQLAEHEGKICCVRCATYNAPDRRSCGSCGAVLPVLMTEIAGPRFEAWDEAPPVAGGFEMTENIQRIINAIDAWGGGHGSLQALLAEVERVEALVQQARESAGDESVEALEAYHGGLDEMGGGAAWLREAMLDGSAATLERGRQAILDGAAMLQQAQRMVSSGV